MGLFWACRAVAREAGEWACRAVAREAGEEACRAVAREAGEGGSTFADAVSKLVPPSRPDDAGACAR
jgi:hypothetical protein